MEELRCGRCSEHLGWIGDNAPRGFILCDSCKETDDIEQELLDANAEYDE